MSGRAARTPIARQRLHAGAPPPGSRVNARTRNEFDRAATGATANHRSLRAALLEATKWYVPGDRNRRHDAVISVLGEWQVASILEVGSGAGDFYTRLRARLPGVCSYTGCDLSPQMVTLAKRRFPGADFRQDDVLRWRKSIWAVPRADAVVAIGVFALLVDDPAAHWMLMRRLIRRMFQLSRIGIVFDFYDFFSEEDARTPRRYFQQEMRQTGDTPIYCVRPAEVRSFVSRLGPAALTRIHGVDGRVWRCTLRRPSTS